MRPHSGGSLPRRITLSRILSILDLELLILHLTSSETPTSSMEQETLHDGRIVRSEDQLKTRETVGRDGRQSALETEEAAPVSENSADDSPDQSARQRSILLPKEWQRPCAGARFSPARDCARVVCNGVDQEAPGRHRH